MRQLVQLHDQLEAFGLLDTDVIAVALEEDDHETMTRVEQLVGSGITYLANAGHKADELSATSAILVDKEGVVRTILPGIVQARAPTKLIIEELAKMTGQRAPTLDELRPPLGDDGPVSARMAWSHDSVGPGDTLKLVFLPEIVSTAFLSASGDNALKVEVIVPEGLEIVSDFRLPRGKPAPERVNLARVHTDDVPMTALELRGTDTLKDGEVTVEIRLTYALCGPRGCHDPEPRVWSLSLPSTAKAARRGELFNWRNW